MLQLNFRPFHVLQSPRLVLRDLMPEDAEAIYLLYNKTKTIEWASQLISTFDKMAITGNGLAWGITLKNQPTVIGTIGFKEIIKEDHRAEIAYILHNNYRGKGIMTEALETVINYAFTAMKLHRIEARISIDNTPSIQLVERCGFAQEGHLKQNYYNNGIFIDTLVYSILNRNG